ncbi:unnamed protein product [Rotaria sordida]|uniref:Uncharacterized protein n=1 Tax=Rotaria sordida TaxID=392033 RepID=A0A818UHA1_9BILA|nr:unnamed protein product [Rotaria sordida]CAF1020594.1 unnamed protein product [Rotaria sordida]CAF3693160.1 unnamed protein product [Rotaria sordida]
MSKDLDPTGGMFSGTQNTMVGKIKGPGKPDPQTSAPPGARTDIVNPNQPADPNRDHEPKIDFQKEPIPGQGPQSGGSHK